MLEIDRCEPATCFVFTYKLSLELNVLRPFHPNFEVILCDVGHCVRYIDLSPSGVDRRSIASLSDIVGLWRAESI